MPRTYVYDPENLRLIITEEDGTFSYKAIGTDFGEISIGGLDKFILDNNLVPKPVKEIPLVEEAAARGVPLGVSDIAQKEVPKKTGPEMTFLPAPKPVIEEVSPAEGVWQKFKNSLGIKKAPEKKKEEIPEKKKEEISEKKKKEEKEGKQLRKVLGTQGDQLEQLEEIHKNQLDILRKNLKQPR